MGQAAKDPSMGGATSPHCLALPRKQAARSLPPSLLFRMRGREEEEEEEGLEMMRGSQVAEARLVPIKFEALKVRWRGTHTQLLHLGPCSLRAGVTMET